MRISIVGSGYVGTTVAACFADLGHDVINIDIDETVVEAINAGDAPIHEDGLPDLIAALDAEFNAMADPVVVDGRRIVERRDGITYEGLTW